MGNAINLVASIITLLNFAYAGFDFFNINPNLFDASKINISPGLGFVVFFFLEIVCSFFIWYSVVTLSTQRDAKFIHILTLALAIINVGTTLFNYKLLFGVERIGFSDVVALESNMESAYVFTLFIAGAFLVDAIVFISVRSAAHIEVWEDRRYWAKPDRQSLSLGTASSLLLIQFTEYFFAVLFIIAVVGRI